MSDMKRLDAELRELIDTIKLAARYEGRLEWKQEILDIHAPIKRTLPGDWVSTYAASYEVCATCRDERGGLTVMWPCRTAQVVTRDYP